MTDYSTLFVYYFSGTGNAQNVAQWVSAIASKKDMQTRLVDISKLTTADIVLPSNGALVVFVSPIHGFNYPPVMLRFIARFPKGKNKVILMSTRAGMLIGKWVTPGLTGVAFYLSGLILTLKGYSIRGMCAIDLPSNWIFLHPGLNHRTVLYLHQRMKQRVERYAHSFLAGKKCFPALKELIQDIIIAPLAVGYYFMGRYVFSKTYLASVACDNCGLCIRQCPVKAIISVNNRLFWTLKCESCMRCVGNCPKKAIETVHGFITVCAFVFDALFLALFYRFYLHFFAHMPDLLIKWVLESVLFLILLVPAYWLMHFFARYRWFNQLIAYTSLTYYRFWGRRYKAIKNF